MFFWIKDIITKIILKADILFTPQERALFYKKMGMHVGNDTLIFSGCSIDKKHVELISLGDHVGISPGTVILAHDASSKDVYAGNCEGWCKIGKVTIGNNVFVGVNCIILPGTQIGDNCIISAGSVVHGKIPENSIVSGNPATIIGKRDVYIAMTKKRMKKENFYDNNDINELKRAFIELDNKMGFTN